jgi:hypothetical protein
LRQARGVIASVDHAGCSHRTSPSGGLLAIALDRFWPVPLIALILLRFSAMH